MYVKHITHNRSFIQLFYQQEAMEEGGLFDFGSPNEIENEEKYYFVVGIRADSWDSNGTKIINVF